MNRDGRLCCGSCWMIRWRAGNWAKTLSREQPATRQPRWPPPTRNSIGTWWTFRHAVSHEVRSLLSLADVGLEPRQRSFPARHRDGADLARARRERVRAGGWLEPGAVTANGGRNCRCRLLALL